MTQRNLFIGLNGDDVKQVQGTLNFYARFMNPPSMYPPLERDGKFGWKTHCKVYEFQQRNKPLVPDGIVGQYTLGRMFFYIFPATPKTFPLGRTSSILIVSDGAHSYLCNGSGQIYDPSNPDVKDLGSEK